MFAVGVDIGGTAIKAGLVEIESGRILDRHTVPFPKGEGSAAVWDRAEACIQQLLRFRQPARKALGAIGVAIPGSLDPSRTHVIHAYNLDFHSAEVRRPLEERFPGISLQILNDGDAAALAEHRFGALKGTKTAALVTLGTGVGGGLILNGKLFGGGLGNGVEIGHMTLNWAGPSHHCGNSGCVEMYCAASALAPESSSMSPRDAIDRIRSGDPKMSDILDRYTDALSGALASIVNLLDPEAIALGGGASNAGEALLIPLREKVYRKAFFETECRIVQAAMGNEAGIVGAAISHVCASQ